MKLRITKKTLDFIQSNKKYSSLLELYGISLKQYEGYSDVEITDDNNRMIINNVLLLAEVIFDNRPKERNRWIIDSREYEIADNNAIRRILLPFECKEEYPFSRFRLNEIVRNNNIGTIKEARKLCKKPFSKILPFAGSDYVAHFHLVENTKENIEISLDHPKLRIRNRYIKNSLKISHGEIEFENCILDGNIEISSPERVIFSQCIVPGKILITGADKVDLSCSNIGEVLLYNSQLERLSIEYCKIYRFEFHSSIVESFCMWKNKFIEPYIADVQLPEKTKIDMSQFITKKIGHETIHRISKTAKPAIKDPDKFFLSFQVEKPVVKVQEDEISYKQADFILRYGNLSTDHNLNARMKYEKAYCTNKGWRKLVVFLTGAYYLPGRWILYLICNTALFAAFYIFLPLLLFKIIDSTEYCRLDFWTAIYYSLCQIIGSNPTNYTPTGITQIFTTLHSLINTTLIANLVASFVKKYIRV